MSEEEWELTRKTARGRISELLKGQGFDAHRALAAVFECSLMDTIDEADASDPDKHSLRYIEIIRRALKSLENISSSVVAARVRDGYKSKYLGKNDDDAEIKRMSKLRHA